MARLLQVSFRICLTGLLFTIPLCSVLLAQQKEAAAEARNELNQGVQAFKGARCDEAAEHFKKALALDPSLTEARLYLGTSYMQQYVPGADTPENNRFAYLASTEFATLLQDPNLSTPMKLHALKSIASLRYNQKNFEEAIEFYRQATGIDPSDPEAYYMLGVIRWAAAYKAAAEAKARIDLKVDDEYEQTEAERQICREQRTANAARIADGIAALDQAIRLRPDYEDAMAYMNLLYRRKADLECADADARATDIATADKWVDKCMAIRKANSQRSQTGQALP
jgi:tetratricopeptide (TPR) repeat protein